MPPPITTYSAWRLTGRIRLRSGFLGRVVAQVEESRTYGTEILQRDHSNTGYRWRDARRKDLTTDHKGGDA